VQRGVSGLSVSLAVRVGADSGGETVDRHIDELRDSYDWAKLQGTVVDVGGGSGHISIALARVSTVARGVRG